MRSYRETLSFAAKATIGAAIIVGLGYGYYVNEAWPHETMTGMKFDTWCCNGNNVNGDCQPIPDKAVKAVTGGYQVTLVPGMHPMVTEPHSYFMPQDKVRRSTDGLAYACLYPTEAELRCLYLTPEAG